MPQQTNVPLDQLLVNLVEKQARYERTYASLDQASKTSLTLGREEALTPQARVAKEARQELETIVQSTAQYNTEQVYKNVRTRYQSKVDAGYVGTMICNYPPRSSASASNEEKDELTYHAVVGLLRKELQSQEPSEDRIRRILTERLGITDPRNILVPGVPNLIACAQQVVANFNAHFTKAYKNHKKELIDIMDKGIADNNAYALASGGLIQYRR